MTCEDKMTSSAYHSISTSILSEELMTMISLKATSLAAYFCVPGIPACGPPPWKRNRRSAEGETITTTGEWKKQEDMKAHQLGTCLLPFHCARVQFLETHAHPRAVLEELLSALDNALRKWRRWSGLCTSSIKKIQIIKQREGMPSARLLLVLLERLAPALREKSKASSKLASICELYYILYLI